MKRLAVLTLVTTLALSSAGCADESTSTPADSAGPSAHTSTPAPTSPGPESGPPTDPGTGSPRPETGDTMDYYRISLGRLGPLEVGTPIQTAEDQGYVQWGDPIEQCAYWEMRGPYAESGEVYVGRDDRITVLGGITERYRTAEGVGPGSTVGQVRAAYGDRLTYDHLREHGGAPIGLILREGDRQVVFLIANNQLDAEAIDPAKIPDETVIEYLYTSVVTTEELRDGPYGSTC